MWAVGVAVLLAIFYCRTALTSPALRDIRAQEPGRMVSDGKPNLFFLGVILVAVFIHHPLFLREGLMFAAALGSYFTTRKPVHDANEFKFHPLTEVAILFVGIFATMIPALDWADGEYELVGPQPDRNY